MTAKLCPRVDQDDQKSAFYSVEYDFDFKDEFEDTGDISFTAVSK